MATKFLYIALLLLAALQDSCQSSLPTDPTYHAGVVEFIPASEGKPRKRTEDNLQRMRQIIDSDDVKDLDILVFPEYVLNNMGHKTFVPEPAQHIAPCDTPDYDNFLVELSCATRSRGIYVVLNLLEQVECAPQDVQKCNDDGLLVYNTNVVLDRQGVVISRYRKTHLYRYEWYSTNVLTKADLSTFTTDFGVTFGHFICFDMLFYDPAMVLIREMNITDIIYPTYWFSELPFLTAVQLQEGWAYGNNVNLLAADASNPAEQNTGSGIYAGKLGRLAAVIHEQPTTRLLKARVPKHGQRYELPPVVQPVFQPELETPRFTELALLRDYNVDIFATQLLPADFTNVSQTVCHAKFCCQFAAKRVLINASPAHAAYRYRLAAYSGEGTTFQRIDPSALSICAIIACTNDELWSCGRIFPAPRLVGNKYYFAALNISGQFGEAERRLIMPSTVDAQMMPLPVNMYAMQQTAGVNGSTRVQMTLNHAKSDLLTFGIWTNYYTKRTTTHNLQAVPRSVQMPVKSAATTAMCSWAALALLALLAVRALRQ